MLLVVALLAVQAEAQVPKPVSSGPWMTNDDYPAAAAKRGHQGSLSYLLRVDASGLPTACNVVISSGYPVLDAAACTILMKRARFTPARSPAGEAVAADFPGRFNWSLGSKKALRSHSRAPNLVQLVVPRLPETYRTPVLANVTFTPTGTVEQCAVKESSGVRELDLLACQYLLRLAVPGAGQSSAPDRDDGVYAVSFRADTPATP